MQPFSSARLKSGFQQQESPSPFHLILQENRDIPWPADQSDLSSVCRASSPCAWLKLLTQEATALAISFRCGGVPLLND